MPLPNELWLNIFALASSSYQYLDCELVGGEFPIGVLQAEERIRILKESSATRLRIVLVCKFWHTLGTPLLYHHLYFHSLPQLQSVLDNFSRPSTGAVLASYVKRVDLFGFISSEVQLFRDLIHILPNLEILTVSARHLPRMRPYGFIQEALANGQGPARSLQALVWYTDFTWQFVAPKHLVDLLRTMPNLRVLRWHVDRTEHSSGREEHASRDPPTLTVGLNSLRTLRLPADALLDPWLLTQHFPSLIRLTCVPSGRTPFYDVNGTDGWRKFIQRHGLQFRHLELQLQPDPTSNTRSLECVERHCTNMSRLDIVIDGWSDLPLRVSLPPPVKTLGLCTRSPGCTQEEYAYLVQVMGTLNAEGLKVLQFLRNRDLLDLVDHNKSLWARAREICSLRGIRVQDYVGSFIEDLEPAPQ